MNKIIEKICNGCGLTKSTTDYYFVNNDKKFYASNCKNCQNKLRSILQKNNPKPKKMLGFKALDINIQQAILDDIQNSLKYRAIATKHNIPYGRLFRWKQKNEIIVM